MVGNDDAPLYARPAVAIRDRIHGHRRQVGQVSPRQDARSGLSLVVHDADDPSDARRLVSQEQRFRGDRSAFQSGARRANARAASQAADAAHTIELPAVPASGEAKKQKALAAAASDGQPILSFLATDWNNQRFTPGKDLVVLETKPGVPPDTFIQILIDDKLAQSPRHVRGREQAFTIELEQTLFVKEVDCVVECDPERRNAVNFRSGSGLMFADVQKAVSVSDVTDPAKPVAVKPKDVKADYDYPSWGYGLDELGYPIQPGRKDASTGCV